ncbi:lactonase family protein [Streptomyces chiangmaiensis]|uniref:Lactonase family protein n=1 Tax=Streptomyces chiangmaiensis TaxID=766497 RepID=A0ABU7FE73_9ACTN|nr:lactonase family protein [Streptomyces chiangmaiensis]MED7822461.1 lactonase family protein [Streptomyces chiangmaiensis]
MAGGGRRRAYIGSFTAAGGRGVLTATVDPDSGALSVVSAVDGVPDPSYLALSGTRLYAVSETADGAVAVYRLDGDRPRLTGPPVPVGGSEPTHLSLHAGHVLTANYGSGSVTALPLRGDGTLVEGAAAVLRHEGSGPVADRQLSPHAHQVQPDPSGRWIVSVDLGTDSVRVCVLHDGALTLHHETALRPGSGPRHLAFHPDGRRVYVLNELTPAVTVCRWDAEAGRLEPVAEAPVLPDEVAGDAYPSGIVVSPDGRFVWTATRGQDVLSVLAVEDDGVGRATTVPCGGVWPRAIALSEGFLYVANERSGDVSWFAVDPVSGVPRRRGSMEAPAASCVVFG